MAVNSLISLEAVHVRARSLPVDRAEGLGSSGFFRARLLLLLVGENVEEQNILVHVAYNPPCGGDRSNLPEGDVPRVRVRYG